MAALGEDRRKGRARGWKPVGWKALFKELINQTYRALTRFPFFGL